MNTIERKLLAVTYPNVDIALLEEIINATPNATLATEIMCGLYVAPEVPKNIWKDNVLRTMTEYDKWDDRVHYTYERNKSTYEYFPKGTLREDVNKDNYKSLRCSYEGDVVRYEIILDEIETKSDYTSLEQWMKFHAAKPYISPGKIKMMEYENMYADDDAKVEAIITKM